MEQFTNKKYMELMKSDQSNVHIFYDIQDNIIMNNDDKKTHKISINIHRTYVDCMQTTNDKNEPIFYIIDNKSLSYHINNAKLTYVSTVYERDKYRGIYFEYSKPNGEKSLYFAIATKDLET